jgi:hypothetical protein
LISSSCKAPEMTPPSFSIAKRIARFCA